MFSVRSYMPGDAFAWDALVASSRNGNLLHRRDYMDYHAERFVDASLLVQRGDTVVAVLPANLQGSCVSSHAGLTYAGLLSSMALRAGATLQVFEQIAAHYRALGVREVIYKPVPHIFHAYPAEEELYALHRRRATVPARLVVGDCTTRAACIQHRAAAFHCQGAQGRRADPARDPARWIPCAADPGSAAAWRSTDAPAG